MNNTTQIKTDCEFDYNAQTIKERDIRGFCTFMGMERPSENWKDLYKNPISPNPDNTLGILSSWNRTSGR